MTVNLDGTQLLPSPTWQNPRVHLLDDLWLMTVLAIVAATGLPWIASGFEIDLGGATSGLLGLGGVYAAVAALASPTRLPGRWPARAMTLLHLIGVVLVAFIWQHVGGVQNPMFLTVFALPVIGSIFISRWHPYLIAAVAILLVGTGAIAQAPDLRWYVIGLVGGDSLINSLFGSPSAVTQPSFSGFFAPSSYLIVMLEVFTVALFACAAAAEYIGTLFERLDAHSITARLEAQRGQELWISLIEQLPLAALLIDPDSMTIVASSGLATRYVMDEGGPLNGRHLFEALRFSYPDSIQELIVGADGEAPATLFREAEHLRLTQIRVLHVARRAHRLALLTIEDTTEVFCLNAALDNSEFAALAVDSRGRVLAFNKLAIVLFGGLKVGTDTSQLLAQPLADQRFWEPGLAGRRKMHVEIGSRIYQATSAAVALPGEEERVFCLSFLPVARDASDSYDTEPTVVTAIMKELR